MSGAASNDFSTPAQVADAKIQKICDAVKPDTEKLVLPRYEHFGEFTASLYRKKSAAFLEIYLIKVFVGGERYAHIRVNEAVTSGELRLVDATYPKAEDDPLVPF